MGVLYNIGSYALGSAFALGNYAVKSATGMGVPDMVMYFLRDWVTLGPDATVKLSPITIMAEDISPSSKLVELVYNLTGLILEANIGWVPHLSADEYYSKV